MEIGLFIALTFTVFLFIALIMTMKVNDELIDENHVLQTKIANLETKDLERTLKDELLNNAYNKLLKQKEDLRLAVDDLYTILLDGEEDDGTGEKDSD